MWHRGQWTNRNTAQRVEQCTHKSTRQPKPIEKKQKGLEKCPRNETADRLSTFKLTHTSKQ